MRLPKNVEICGEIISIEVKDLGEKHGGWYHPSENRIEICETLKGADKDVKFLHEFLHGVHDKSSLTQSIPDGVEEVLVNQTAKALIKNFILTPRKRPTKKGKKK